MEAIIIALRWSTSEHLLKRLLYDRDYTFIKLFVTAPSGYKDPKLLECIVDFSNLLSLKKMITGDVVFCCADDNLKRMSFNYKELKRNTFAAITFAEMARENEVNSFVLISSYGACPDSFVSYYQIKGQLEKKIGDLHFDQLIIFRPWILESTEKDNFAEMISVRFLKMLNFLKLFTEFRPLSESVLAEKLSRAPKELPSGTNTLELKRIFSF